LQRLGKFFSVENGKEKPFVHIFMCASDIHTSQSWQQTNKQSSKQIEKQSINQSTSKQANQIKLTSLSSVRICTRMSKKQLFDPKKQDGQQFK